MSFTMTLPRILCISGLLLSAASFAACGAPPTTPNTNTCSNGTKDATETDADCGGSSSCARCAVGKACTVNSDCQSNQCTSGVCATASASCPLIGQQLLENPGAEDGQAAADQGTLITIPGWTSTTQHTVIAYGNPNGFPSTTDPGPPQRGKNFFTGGNTTPSSASQSVDLSACGAAIDAGSLKFDFSAYIGGLNTQGDNAMVVADFRNANSSLGNVTLGPVTLAERKNVTELLLKQGSLATVPSGARTLVVTMTSTRTDGTGNDGYVDNLSAIVTNK